MADLSKLASYAVKGGAEDAATLTKAIGYAVTAQSDSFESFSKLVAYAVTESVANNTRPVVFVCT
jgi:hypothetical protein